MEYAIRFIVLSFFEHNLVLLRDMGVSEMGKGIVDETFM